MRQPQWACQSPNSAADDGKLHSGINLTSMLRQADIYSRPEAVAQRPAFPCDHLIGPSEKPAIRLAIIRPCVQRPTADNLCMIHIAVGSPCVSILHAHKPRRWNHKFRELKIVGIDRSKAPNDLVCPCHSRAISYENVIEVDACEGNSHFALGEGGVPRMTSLSSEFCWLKEWSIWV